MRDDQLSTMYDYLDRYVSHCDNGYNFKASLNDPSWDTVMTLLECIEANYEVVEFKFHRNWFRIETGGGINGRPMQDKGMNLKQAIIRCCFRFLSERDKNAPKLDLPTDHYLLDEDEYSNEIS